jgi:sugar/nucleoside kinase (ribokinase family)
MSQTDMIMDYVETSKSSPTLFSFCFLYPDGSGGNLTTNDSACSDVDPFYVEKSKSEFERFTGHSIALAAPEVSLDARMKLLELATEHNFFRVASFTSEEMGSAIESGILTRTDLLAINHDEAAAAVKMSVENNDTISVIESAIEHFIRINEKMFISITKGREGSWSWDGSDLKHLPIHQVDVESTAGAGDAHLAGLIVGLTAGLSLQDAHVLAALVGSLSVTSPHTINKDIDRESLRLFADHSAQAINKNVSNLLEK